MAYQSIPVPDRSGAPTASNFTGGNVIGMFTAGMWMGLIRDRSEMGHGEIERLKIQNGIPVTSEDSIQRIKLH